MSGNDNDTSDAAKAVKTYLKTGDGSALDALPQRTVIEYVTKKTRPLQKDHGSVEKDTAAAHRNQHEHVCKNLRESATGLSNRDVVQVMAVVDTDLRMGPSKWNKDHTNIENAEKKARETGAAPMNAKTGVTQSAVAARNIVRVNQIEMAFAAGEIGEKAARWWLADTAKPLMSGGVSPLAAWKATTAQNTVKHKFRELVSETLEQNGGDVALNVKEAPLRADKTIAKTSALVKRGQLVYKDDGTVDPKCEAFKLGLVDKNGRQTEVQKAADQGHVHVKGHYRDGKWIDPHQRHAPGSSAAAKPKAPPAAKPKAATPAKKTVTVKAHTRSDGVFVQAYSRAAPKTSSSSSSSTSRSSGGGGGGSTYVSGYTRLNGTKVAGHYRSTGKK